MLEQMCRKREDFRVKMRRRDVDLMLTNKRHQLMGNLEVRCKSEPVSQSPSKFRRLGQELLQCPNLLLQTSTQLEHFCEGLDFAWCTLITIYTASDHISKQSIVGSLASHVPRFIDHHDDNQIVQIGLKCWILIASEQPNLLSRLTICKSLLLLYYQNKTLKKLVTRVVMCYLCINEIAFHHRIVCQQYFQVLNQILNHSKQSKHLNQLADVLHNLFSSGVDFIELYFPIFDALVNLVHLHPTAAQFVMWRTILGESSNCLVDWTVQKGFLYACMDVLRAPLDKQLVLATIECMQKIMDQSSIRMIGYDKQQAPLEILTKEGLFNILQDLSMHSQMYSEGAQYILNKYFDHQQANNSQTY